MKNLLLIAILISSSQLLNAQKHSFGIGAGASIMFGDLGGGKSSKSSLNVDLPSTKYVLSTEYNFLGKKFYEFGIQLNYAKVSGDDQYSAFSGRNVRAMKFESSIYELAFINRFNLFSRKKDNSLRKFYPFTAIGIGIFHFNPYADGRKLKPLGTSGQNIQGSALSPYSSYAVSIPFEIGFNLNIREKSAIRVDFSYHSTTTDWIDDVAAVPYADPTEVQLTFNGETTGDAAHYAQPGEQHAALRGDPKNDAFLFIKLNWIKKF